MFKITAIMVAMLVAFGAIAEDVKVKTADMAKRRELAAKFMKVMKTEEQLKGSFKMIRSAQAQMLKKMLKNSKDIALAQKAQDELMVIIQEEMSWKTLKPIFVDTYASVYSVDELDALIKFFSSPKGQAFVAKSPQVARLTMKNMQSIMLKMAERIKVKMDKIKKDAIKAKLEEKKNTPPAAPKAKK